jgi:hypothetical protein
VPYIKPEDRAKFHLHADHGAEGIKLVADNAGELQYCFAVLIKAYLMRKAPFRYQEINDVMGALAGAQMEFYRVVVADYESAKCEQNGDVYD